MNELERAAKHWSNPPPIPGRTRWWQSSFIVSHINKNICGEFVNGTHGGDIKLIHSVSKVMLSQAISVGCGTAFHEIKLLEANVVGHFDLYEISEDRIKKIKDAATKAGVLDRIDIFNVNPLELNHKKKYDLVYWKDALHHMLNAKYGVEWSFEMLNQSGLFFMNDFVGPSYMQYSEKSLDIAEKVRKSLPVRCLTDPRDPSKTLPYRRVRPDIETIKSIDPTECADSSNIIPALKIVFDKVNIIPTGGVVYSLALSDVLANLHEEHDSELLSTLMMCDDVCTSLGEYLYAVAYAIKD